MNRTDRAPSNLLSSGAFARASPSLAAAAEEVVRQVRQFDAPIEPLKGRLAFNFSVRNLLDN